MNIEQLTAPVQQPLDIDDAKRHLRLIGSDQDAMIDGLIQVVTSYLDGRHGILGRSLMTQDWRFRRRGFSGYKAPLVLPLPPVKSVLSVKYFDADNVEQTMPAADYSLETGTYEAELRPAVDVAWPTVSLARAWPVTIDFRAGYGDTPADVPAAIRHAMLLMIGRLYYSPEDDREYALRAFDALLAPHRVALGAL